MRRPITALLLFVFLAFQLYRFHSVKAPAALGSGFRRLAAVPTGVLHWGPWTYLIGEHAVWSVAIDRGQVRVQTVSARWMEVPEPSGAGSWKALVNADGAVLLGLGGPVFTAPNGHLTLWVDPGSHTLYRSEGITSPLMPVPGLTAHLIKWASNGQRAAIFGEGPQGQAIYTLDAKGTVRLALPAVKSPVRSMGFNDRHEVIAALDNGQIGWQGHPMQPVNWNPAWVSPTGAVLGFSEDRAVWWNAGLAHSMAVPAQPISAPRFSENSQEAAYVGRKGGKMVLVIVTTNKVTTVPLPIADVEVAGFLGSEVIVSALGGTDRGTYILVNP